jgi:hypothetical protein
MGGTKRSDIFFFVLNSFTQLLTLFERLWLRRLLSRCVFAKNPVPGQTGLSASMRACCRSAMKPSRAIK